MGVIDDVYADIAGWRGALGESLGDRASRDLELWALQYARGDRLVHFWNRPAAEPLQPGDRARCGLVVPADYNQRPAGWTPGDMPCARCTHLMGYVP